MPKASARNYPNHSFFTSWPGCGNAGYPLIKSSSWPGGWIPSRRFPTQKWFKRFAGFTICGEGELVKTFLTGGQAPEGEEIR
jgi:hypothetical protein